MEAHDRWGKKVQNRSTKGGLVGPRQGSGAGSKGPTSEAVKTGERERAKSKQQKGQSKEGGEWTYLNKTWGQRRGHAVN